MEMATVMRVWLYPADGMLGGTIEARDAIGADARKVYFSDHHGARRSVVFFTVQQAQLARFKDISEEFP